MHKKKRETTQSYFMGRERFKKFFQIEIFYIISLRKSGLSARLEPLQLMMMSLISHENPLLNKTSTAAWTFPLVCVRALMFASLLMKPMLASCSSWERNLCIKREEREID